MTEKLIPISAVIVIRNEAHMLREYFEHLNGYVDEFVVADQCSTDNSVEICKEYGAKVIQTNNWGYSEPDKEFILRQIKNEWAIILDPDERFNNNTLVNLQNILQTANKNGCDGIEFPVCFILDGYKINYISGRKQVRIVRKGCRCSTRIHSAYSTYKNLCVNEPQFHFKHSEDHFGKESSRIKLDIEERIKENTIKQNCEINKELEQLKKRTEEFNKTFESDINKFPKNIIIETSVNCNANCVMCPNYKIKRDVREMPMELFKKIIDQCVGKEVKEIHPFMHGEPFVVKDIFEKMEYVNQILPNTEIVLFSNAGVFDEEKAKKLVKIKNIQSITFSVDATTEETYKLIRRNLDFKTSVNNILNFIKINNEVGHPIKTCVSMTVSEYNEKERDDFYSFWKDKVDYIDRHRCTGRSSDVGVFASDCEVNHFKQIPCSTIFNTMGINTDGKVSMCCEDYTPKVVLGNVNTDTIENIWNSLAYKRVRRLHLLHRKCDLPVCKDCGVCM